MAFMFISTTLLLVVCSSMDLDALYNNDTILTPGTEYTINNDIVIESNVIFQIPNNVVLSFNGSYTISVEGRLIIGCNQYIDNSRRGITDQTSDILIHSITGTNNGEIDIKPTGNATICNTLFQNLEYGLYIESSSNDILIDNCEFHNISQGAIYLDISGSSSNIIITDNIFMDNTKAIATSYSNYGNLLIQNNLINYVSIDCCFSSVVIENNTFHHNGGYSNGLNLDSRDAVHVENNHFSGYQTGIIFERSTGNVRYNTFIDNERGINIYNNLFPDQMNINYNNFINNTYSLWTQSEGPFPNCNYNYYGTSSTEQSIVSQQIADICIGDGSGYPHDGLIIWWPWYIQPIDFRDFTPNSSQSSAVTFEPDLLNCKEPGTVSSGTKLNLLYDYGITWNSSNLILTAAGSPYYVKHDVVINANIAMIVEPNVEIIFSIHTDIWIRGSLNINCDTNHTIDTNSDHNNIGLSDINTSVTIRVQSNSSPYGGRIMIDDTGSIKACNTKFDNLLSAVHVTGYNQNQVMIDNCEFYGGHDGIYLDVDGDANKTITNSIFQDVDEAIKSEGGLTSELTTNILIENNLFNTSGGHNEQLYFLSPTTNSFIINNTFIYTGNAISDGDQGIVLANRAYVVYIQYNIFKNFEQAIWIAAGKGSIKYNTFTNNQKAIDICSCAEGQMEINYNNFINNTYAIALEDGTGNADQLDCNYNYYDTSNGSTPTADIIVLQIYDSCNYAPDGEIIWYPWFNQQIDFHALPTNSSAIDLVEGELTCYTQPPTPSPTEIYYDTNCSDDSFSGGVSKWLPIHWRLSINTYEPAVTFKTCGSTQGLYIDIFRANDTEFLNPLQIERDNCTGFNYGHQFTLPLKADNYTIRTSCLFVCDYILQIFGCGTNGTLSTPSPIEEVFNSTNGTLSTPSPIEEGFNSTNGTLSTPSPIQVFNSSVAVNNSEPTQIPTISPISPISPIPIPTPNICPGTPYECSNGKVILQYYSADKGQCVYPDCFTPSPIDDQVGNANMFNNFSLTLIFIFLFCVFV